MNSKTTALDFVSTFARIFTLVLLALSSFAFAEVTAGPAPLDIGTAGSVPGITPGVNTGVGNTQQQGLVNQFRENQRQSAQYTQDRVQAELGKAIREAEAQLKAAQTALAKDQTSLNTILGGLIKKRDSMIAREVAKLVQDAENKDEQDVRTRLISFVKHEYPVIGSESQEEVEKVSVPSLKWATTKEGTEKLIEDYQNRGKKAREIGMIVQSATAKLPAAAGESPESEAAAKVTKPKDEDKKLVAELRQSMKGAKELGGRTPEQITTMIRGLCSWKEQPETPSDSTAPSNKGHVAAGLGSTAESQ